MKILAMAAMVSCALAALVAQKSSPADIAAKFTGTWKINRELSPSIGRGRGRGGAQAAAPQARLALASFQRGGGGRGIAEVPSPPDLTPEEAANRAAVQSLQQIPELLTIEATADSITFKETRGTFAFPINNKGIKMDIGAAKVDAKTKWDKTTLRQEFNTPQQKLTRAWDVDETGRLVLKLRVESMSMSSAEAVAVFDKQ
jgi:hypothetical protein